MLLNIQHYGEDEQHPDRLIFKFEKFTFRNRFEYMNQEIQDTYDSVKYKLGYKNGYKSARDRIFKKVSKGDQIVALLPTAGGKSFCFQLPVSFRPGITLVLSPLGALFHEQDVSVKINYRFHSSAFISPKVDADDRKVLCTDIKLGKIRLVYVTPESLNIKLFREKLKYIIGRTPVNVVVIDAAHCISEWGYDFRPSYLKVPDFINELKKDNPRYTLIALTASTGNVVKRDIMNTLKLKIENVAGIDLYRQNLSYQVVQVDNSKQKIEAYQKVILNDIPSALRCENFIDVFRDSDGASAGSAFCIYTNSDGKDGAAFYLDETQKILSEQKIFNSKDFSSAGKRLFPSKKPALWPQYLYSYFTSSFKNGDSAKEPNQDVTSPGPLISTREPNMDVHTGNIRFVVHTSMADSIENWYREAGRAGRDGERAHCVQIIDMPDLRCEEDMLNRNIDIPKCSEQGCAFGRENLCDYGRQHITIAAISSNIVSDTIQILHTLDGLLDSVKTNESPVKIETPSGYESHIELSLFRLSIIGVIRQYLVECQKDKSVFEVSDFTEIIDENYALHGLLSYLKQIDISSNRKFQAYTIEHFLGQTGEIHRQREKYGDELENKISSEIEKGKLRHHSSDSTLFDRVSDYMLVLLSYLYENLMIMRYRRLWNLKEFIRTNSCRYAELLKNFQVVDENWICGDCDICFPDLKFSAVSQRRASDKEKLKELEKRFEQWLENDEVPFNIDAANQFINEFSDFATNIYIRASGILERSPRNIKALYLAREFSPEPAKGKNTLDLMRIAGKDMPSTLITGFYETSPDSLDIRSSVFDLLDDEYGAFNSIDGKRWLFREAIQLSIEPSRVEILGASLILDALKQTNFSVLKSKLSQLL